MRWKMCRIRRFNTLFHKPNGDIAETYYLTTNINAFSETVKMLEF